MGLLTISGSPMEWGSESNDNAVEYVRKHGIEQFVILYKKFQRLEGSPFLWGDELEHIVVRRDEDSNTRLSLGGAVRAQQLRASHDKDAHWHPEYGAHMVESTPHSPYSMELSSLLSVVDNMKARVRTLNAACEEGESSVLLVTFPLMGQGDMDFVSMKDRTENWKDTPHSHSFFVPDSIMNPHPRFATLTRNIRLRRGRKVCIQIPMLLDRYTNERTVDHRLNIDNSPSNHRLLEPGTEFGCRPKKNCVSTCPLFSRRNSAQVEDIENGPIVSSPVKSSPLIGQRESQENRELSHQYTPATDFFYAQYAKKTFELMHMTCPCPCPVPSDNHPCIYMDCMAFGMGNSCLQVTMQLNNMVEARHVFDQLLVLCPIFLAMTSATPFQKGILCDTDVRWITIAAAVDDRRRDEVPRIIKSRYDSASMFISSLPRSLEALNDERIEVDAYSFSRMVKRGVDERMARHISHMFIRDPLVIYDNGVELDDYRESDHFENVHTSNWQTVRFKAPPHNTDIGWRVEFRPMEIQPTPFENAAFSVFVILVARAMLKYNCNFYIPISHADENMGRAHRRNPCDRSYRFRTNWFSHLDDAPSVSECSVNDILNGSSVKGIVGLIPLVRRYLSEERLEHPLFARYLEFISLRASGQLMTTAQMLRSFVLNHPAYEQDSRLNSPITNDLIDHLKELNRTGHLDGYLPRELSGGSQL